MFGFLLTTLSTFFEEISTTFGKKEAQAHHEDANLMIFLSYLGGLVFFILLLLIQPQAWHFSWQSWPFLGFRIILNIFISYLATYAVIHSERSTFSFGRTITIVFLLAFDWFSGVELGMFKILGIAIIIFTLYLAYYKGNSFKWQRDRFIIYSAILAAVAIAVYQYDIKNFNSVAAEQTISLFFLLLYFAITTYRHYRKNLFTIIKKYSLWKQSGFHGLGLLLESFSYLFLPASLIIALKRSLAVFWSIIFGRAYFKEKHIIAKLALGMGLISGLCLLIFG